MLNFYYLYSWVSLLIIILYSFHWSDELLPLCFEVKIFFFITIVVSFILGKIFSKNFGKLPLFYKVPKNIHKNTLLIILFTIIEFIYCREIPLFSILSGRLGAYTSYTGIPTIHVLIVTFAAFYAQYIFYIYLNSPSNRLLLLDYLVILFFVYFLTFNRAGICISLFMALLSFINYNIRKFRFKYIALHLLFVLLGLYLFGVLGNIRSGCAWNDSSYIFRIAKANNNYPNFVPKEFFWAYVYITSPLANFNYNVIRENISYDFLNYIYNYVPDFVTKRLLPNESPKIILNNNLLNVCVGFTGAYVAGGLIGAFFMYFFIFTTFTLLLYFIKPSENCYIPYILLFNTLIAFFFFSNTIRSSGISFQIIYPIFSAIKLNIKKFQIYIRAKRNLNI